VRDSEDAFHLAIPAHNLEDAEEFYVRLLGCKLARRYDDRITLDFFGDQLVCHLSEPSSDTVETLDLYPRHFGVTFHDAPDFEAVHRLCVQRKIPMFCEMTHRFEGMAEVHRTFVLQDPSSNLIEFKHYTDARMMY
jgi:extradiol dioxygenase family protein